LEEFPKVAKLLALVGALVVLGGCGSRKQTADLTPTPALTPLDPVLVDASYGTLSFHGTVGRFDNGSEFEYRTHIGVTFHPNARVNRTSVVNLREWRFVASVPGDDANGPWKMLYQDSSPMSIHLAQDGDTAHLPDITFRLSKATVAHAQQVGLSVDDGHMLWPIPVNLQ
jgi:hypothetical protein